MAYTSAVQEFQNYEWLPGRKMRTCITRIEEIMDFAKKIHYRKLGLAYCAGLRYEAKLAAQIFLAKGFELASVCCKCSSTPKEEVGLSEEQKIRGPGTIEMMCSPITQAMLLNDAKVDLAVLTSGVKDLLGSLRLHLVVEGQTLVGISAVLVNKALLHESLEGSTASSDLASTRRVYHLTRNGLGQRFAG